MMISTAGRRVQLIDGFRQAFRRAGIVGRVLALDTADTAPSRYLADEAFSVPRIDDPGYLDHVWGLCRRHNVALLVPTIDPELPLLAEERQRFLDVGILVAISDPETVGIAADKRATHEWLMQHGFPTVRQWELAQLTRGDFARHGRVLVKPVRGSMSQGIYAASSLAEVQADDCSIAQEIADGPEYTVSTYVTRDGRCLGAVPRERLEVRAGEVSKGRTVHLPHLEELVTDLMNELPAPYGALNVQVFDGSAGPKIIEINARFGGGDPLAWAAGAHFPYAMVLDVLGRRPTGDEVRWTPDVLMLRFDQAVYVMPEGGHLVG